MNTHTYIHIYYKYSYTYVGWITEDRMGGDNYPSNLIRCTVINLTKVPVNMNSVKVLNIYFFLFPVTHLNTFQNQNRSFKINYSLPVTTGSS